MKKPAARTYNVHEAKTHLSKLLERTADGEEIIIARAGVPVARLVLIAEDFDAPLPPDLLDAFER